MIIPDFMDVIDAHLMTQWRDEIETTDVGGYKKDLLEAKEKLAVILDDENKKLADLLVIAVDNYYSYTYYLVAKQLFYFAFKAGMDMQKALDVEA